jgi:hypothetical protein
MSAIRSNMVQRSCSEVERTGTGHSLQGLGLHFDREKAAIRRLKHLKLLLLPQPISVMCRRTRLQFMARFPTEAFRRAYGVRAAATARIRELFEMFKLGVCRQRL